MHNKKTVTAGVTAAPTPVSRLDWDDLRYVLFVARNGSLSGAARELAVTHSTMLRRIDAIEAKLQVRLFERMRNGYVVTEAGDAMRRIAEQCEPLVAEAERSVLGGDTRLTGSLRVTTAFVVAQHLLPQALAQFCGAYPEIEVQMLTTPERVDLSRRYADIAVRMSNEVPDYLIGRKLGQARFRVYGWHAAPFLAGAGKKPKPRPIDVLVRTLPWISVETDVPDRFYNRWLQANVPASSIVMRSDHFPNTLALLRTGMGVTIMPEFVTADVDGLVALSEPIDALQTPIWILTHPDLRNTARVRAFMQVVGDCVTKALNPR